MRTYVERSRPVAKCRVILPCHINHSVRASKLAVELSTTRNNPNLNK